MAVAIVAQVGRQRVLERLVQWLVDDRHTSKRSREPATCLSSSSLWPRRDETGVDQRRSRTERKLNLEPYLREAECYVRFGVEREIAGFIYMRS